MLNKNEKILVLGATGFVGRNIVEVLQLLMPVIQTTRNTRDISNNTIVFDIANECTWGVIKKIKPTCIINSIGYGVVKTESDTEKVYDINYFKTVAFYEYLSNEMPNVSIVHIGTAFEYDVSQIQLTEASPTLPLTHYGISKLMTSNYLLQKKMINPFIIVRPFNMFGKYEDESKILPSLILAQKNKKAIDLSSGFQRRDFCYVGDFSKFISILIQANNFNQLARCINVGTGSTHSIRDLAKKIAEQLPSFDESLWKWNSLPQRTGEHYEFYNSSTIAQEIGFEWNTLEVNLQKTINYYWNL